MDTNEWSPNRQSESEEAVNVLIHGSGFALSVFGFFVLLASALWFGDLSHVAGSAVFASSLSMVYLSSTLYHGVQNAKLKRFFREVDHVCIYLLIAGTITFLALTVIKGAMCWAVLGIEWFLVVCGIALKLLFGVRHDRISVMFYIFAASIVFLGSQEMIDRFSFYQAALMASGCGFYLLGIPFYLMDQKYKFFHSVWHAFVLAGSLCHYFMALLIIPWP